MIYPDWKIVLAKKCFSRKATTSHTDVINLISVLKNECPNENATNLINECLAIYNNNPFTKEILEACLLCDDYNVYDTIEITGIPLEVIDVYSYFFFDLKVFKYRIYKYEYARNYENPKLPDAKLYKSWAMGAGIKFFKWHLKKPGGFEVVPREVLVDLVGDTFFRAKEHLNESITSSVTKESLKWVKQATESIAMLHRVEDSKQNNSAEELTKFKIALEYKSKETKDDIADAEIIG